MNVALLVVTLLLAATNWWSRLRDDARLEQWTKPLTTVAVIGLALVSGAPTEQVVVATIALALCLVGDIALLPAVDRFVVGLGAFLLGHLAFIVLFVQYGIDAPTLSGIALVLAGLLIATVGAVIVKSAAVRDPGLKKPVLAYLCVISAMGAVGWGTGEPWVIAGATLFVVSDSVLGWRQFVHSRPWMPVTVMVTYHAAIVSLALSLW